MLRALIRAAVGGLIAGLLVSAAAHFLLQPAERPHRRADEDAGLDALSDEEKEHLLRELGNLT